MDRIPGTPKRHPARVNSPGSEWPEIVSLITMKIPAPNDPRSRITTTTFCTVAQLTHFPALPAA